MAHMTRRTGIWSAVFALLAGCTKPGLEPEQYAARLRTAAEKVPGVVNINHASYVVATFSRSAKVTVTCDSDERARMLDVLERLARACVPLLDEPGQGGSSITLAVGAAHSHDLWVTLEDFGLRRSVTFDTLRERFS